MFTEQIDIDAVCARAESLCRRIAPHDLGDAPLYIVPQSRLPAELGGNSVADGFTSPSLDLYIKNVIGSAWRGRGACMVVNDTDFGGQMDAADVELAVSGIVLHEMAHVIERPAAYRDRLGADPGRIQYEALCMGDAVSHEPPSTEIVAPFQGHGLRFIRAALHLRHRAETVGTLVPIYYFCAGTYYGLSHPNRYRDALGDEPDRLAGCSIREILDTPYPVEFWRLWTRDVAHWHSGCPHVLKRSTAPCQSLP